MRILPAALAVFVVCGLLARAEADERAQVVAVIPLATDDGLAIYSKPTADVLAARLSKSGARVESLSLSGDTPGRVALVVDGRIARAGGGKVVIEARVRDPRRARIAVDTITTDPLPLARIDELADDLAARLAPRLREALAEQQRMARAEAAAVRERKVIRLPTSVVRGQLPETGARDSRPPMLVFRAAGRHADSGVVTRHGYWLAERLGHRPVASSERGIPALPVVTAELARAGADYGLMLHVRDVDLRWKGVLTARGRVRVVLVDGRGNVLFDRTTRTGTLVGSRGEGPDALVHYIAEQSVEIVTPHLKRVFAARRGRSAR